MALSEEHPTFSEPIAVVLTALEKEFIAVRALISDVERLDHPDGTIYEVGRLTLGTQVWRVALAQTGQGNVNAGIEATRAFEFFSPSLMLFVGVAGGIKSDLRLGDVVAARCVHYYEMGKESPEEYLPRIQTYNTDYRLLQVARHVARNSGWIARIQNPAGEVPRAFVEALAAGEKVIASTTGSVIPRIRATTSDAYALEMESFGAMAGAFQSQLPFLAIRGVSDMLEGKEEADRLGMQEIAVRHAAAFAIEVIANWRPVRRPVRMNPEASESGVTSEGTERGFQWTIELHGDEAALEEQRSQLQEELRKLTGDGELVIRKVKGSLES